jgi:hypothetical protein
MKGDEFTSFDAMMESKSVSLPPNSRLGNIIRHTPMDPDPHHEAGTSADRNSPQIIVHRDGNQIVRIEFVCQCGRTSDVILEYDGE